MSVAQRHVAQQYAGRGGPSGLADVLEVLLDKGLVIDAYVRVSLVGIELLTVDARVVVASVDTYLRFAEAVNRLDLTQASNAQTLGDLVSGDTQQRGAKSKTKGALEGADSGRSNGDGRSQANEHSDDDDRHGLIERALHRSGDDPSGERERQTPGSEQGEQRSPADDDTGAAKDAGGEDDEPGLLSRIKERGQAF